MGYADIIAKNIMNKQNTPSSTHIKIKKGNTNDYCIEQGGKEKHIDLKQVLYMIESGYAFSNISKIRTDIQKLYK